MEALSAWDVIQALGVALVAVTTWLGKGLYDRVAKLEETAALKTDLAELRLDFKDHRTETREGLSEINDSVKQILMKLAE